MNATCRICLFAYWLFASAGGVTAQQARTLPAQVVLDGRGMRHRILVERTDAGQFVGPVVDVVLQSSDPAVAKVDGMHVVAIADGSATIRVLQRDQQIAAVNVIVRNAADRFRYSFRNHVQSILTKRGCNSGACHGALAGKGGFRLSLRGYNTERDYFNITTQQLGRRIDRANPGLSLLLAKPTVAVPHRGGKRLEEDSRDYRIVAEWVADGAPAPQKDDARLTQLKILPESARLAQGTVQPLLVQAVYSDGRIEDVTQWAKFSSANEAVVTVDENGNASIVGPGEGAVTAWFGSRIVIARLTSPFDNTVPAETFVLAGRRNFIDDIVLHQLRRLNLPPSPVCSDEVFIRRAFIDTIGTLPTADEVRTFLADGSTTKRDALIEHLLQRSEFNDYWSYHWSDLLMINGTLLRPAAVKAFYTWVHNHVEANTPWDQFVREIIVARGSSIENGATNFYALHQSPEDMAENISQAFLGLSIGCARCHNHPLEKWTNDQYYSFANLFSRVRAKGWGGDPRNGDGRRTLVTVSTGDLVQPRTGKPQPPAPLDAPPLPSDSPIDRRVYLADWLVSPENQLFSRSITNRVWRNYMGKGLVEPVDDMRASNPASNEELLHALSDYLVDHNFNLKSLMREILQSETYQRSSRPLAENRADQRHYSHYFPRRLMAEVLLDAVSQVTGVPSDFNKIEFPGADVRDTDFYPRGTRAIQLYDSAVKSYFLQTFGRNQRRITCECERSDQPSMVQVLHIANGNTVNGKLQQKDNRLQQLLDQHQNSAATLVEELFLSSVSRYPTERELSQLTALIKETPASDLRPLVEDIAWGLLSSREFLFNH